MKQNVNEAINHIKTFGTNHTECIISSNKSNINKFEGSKYKVYLVELVDHLIIREK